MHAHAEINTEDYRDRLQIICKIFISFFVRVRSDQIIKYISTWATHFRQSRRLPWFPIESQALLPAVSELLVEAARGGGLIGVVLVVLVAVVLVVPKSLIR